MNITDIGKLKTALDRISFAPSCINFEWKFEINEVQVHPIVSQGFSGLPSGWFVNTTFRRPDVLTGEIGIGRGRKEFIPFNAAEDSAIKTAWVLVEMIVKHELMEAFLVDGIRIFDPHSSIETLKLGKTKCLEARGVVPL